MLVLHNITLVYRSSTMSCRVGRWKRGI